MQDLVWREFWESELREANKHLPANETESERSERVVLSMAINVYGLFNLPLPEKQLVPSYKDTARRLEQEGKLIPCAEGWRVAEGVNDPSILTWQKQKVIAERALREGWNGFEAPKLEKKGKKISLNA